MLMMHVFPSVSQTQTGRIKAPGFSHPDFHHPRHRTLLQGPHGARAFAQSLGRRL